MYIWRTSYCSFWYLKIQILFLCGVITPSLLASVCFGTFGLSFSTFQLLCLAKDNYGSLFVPHKRKILCRYNNIYVVITTSDGCRYNEILSRYNDFLSRYNDKLSRYNDKLSRYNNIRRMSL